MPTSPTGPVYLDAARAFHQHADASYFSEVPDSSVCRLIRSLRRLARPARVDVSQVSLDHYFAPLTRPDASRSFFGLFLVSSPHPDAPDTSDSPLVGATSKLVSREYPGGLGSGLHTSQARPCVGAEARVSKPQARPDTSLLDSISTQLHCMTAVTVRQSPHRSTTTHSKMSGDISPHFPNLVSPPSDI